MRAGDSQEYFATASSSLVADDRAELGVMYNDQATDFLENVTIDGSVTDTTHTITLTAPAGHRHYARLARVWC